MPMVIKFKEKNKEIVLDAHDFLKRLEHEQEQEGNDDKKVDDA